MLERTVSVPLVCDLKRDLQAVIGEYLKTVNPHSNSDKVWSYHGKSGRVRAIKLNSDLDLASTAREMFNKIRCLPDCTLCDMCEKKMQDLFHISYGMINSRPFGGYSPLGLTASSNYKYSRKINLHNIISDAINKSEHAAVTMQKTTALSA
jgi:hypothetical protein